MTCDKVFPLNKALAEIKKGNLAPDCACGGYLKPDTISFGQSLREDNLQRAAELSRGSAFFLVIGSTLIVTPASLMPQYALDNGAFLAFINMSETPYDHKCDVLIGDKAGPVMAQIVSHVERTMAK